MSPEQSREKQVPDKRAQVAALLKEIDRELRGPLKPRPPTAGTRALNAKIVQLVEKLKTNYSAYQNDRTKAAVYFYLRSIYGAGSEFEENGQSEYLKRQIETGGGPKARSGESIFAYLLKSTSAANRKTRNKWARSLEIAFRQEIDADDLIRVIRNARGFNNYIQKSSTASKKAARSHKGRAATKPRLEDDGWGEDDFESDVDDDWGDDSEFELTNTSSQDFGIRVPKAVKAACKEAIKCFKNEAFTATVLMCNLVIQQICAAHGVESGEIGASLNRLHDSGLLDANQLTRWRDEASRIVEVALGGRTAVTRREAGELVEFTQTVTKGLFL
jgi:hypothetical protein